MWKALKYKMLGKYLIANSGERATITLYKQCLEFWPSYGGTITLYEHVHEFGPRVRASPVMFSM
jgi:hypothetical protein